MRGVCACVLSIMAVLSSAGCASSASHAGRYKTYAEPKVRDSILAQRLNDEGLKQIESGNYEAAEHSFRKALEADLFYAAAHNNLGLVLAQQGLAYEAAWEYQYAAKLLPNSAEPRHNLGTLMEKLVQMDEAEKAYDEALEIDPDNVEVMGHLARVYIKSDQAHRSSDTNEQDRTDTNKRLRSLLLKIVRRSNGGEWDNWARQWLIRLGE